MVGTVDTAVAVVELGTGSAVVEMELGIDKAVAVEELGTAAVVEVGIGTALVVGLDTRLVVDKLAFDWVRYTAVEQNQTSCIRAAAAATVAAARQKSFGKIADQMDHSTMGYRWSACIASSRSSVNMSLESVPLEKTKLIKMTLVLNNFVRLLLCI